jgi:hypothetical protein
MEIENDPALRHAQPQQTPPDPANDLEDVRPVILGPAFLFEEAAHHEQVRAQFEKAKKYPSLVVDPKTVSSTHPFSCLPSGLPITAVVFPDT